MPPGKRKGAFGVTACHDVLFFRGEATQGGPGEFNFLNLRISPVVAGRKFFQVKTAK
jgi:hypothetical protein